MTEIAVNICGRKTVSWKLDFPLFLLMSSFLKVQCPEWRGLLVILFLHVTPTGACAEIPAIPLQQGEVM